MLFCLVGICVYRAPDCLFVFHKLTLERRFDKSLVNLPAHHDKQDDQQQGKHQSCFRIIILRVFIQCRSTFQPVRKSDLLQKRGKDRTVFGISRPRYSCKCVIFAAAWNLDYLPEDDLAARLRETSDTVRKTAENF